MNTERLEELLANLFKQEEGSDDLIPENNRKDSMNSKVNDSESIDDDMGCFVRRLLG